MTNLLVFLFFISYHSPVFIIGWFVVVYLFFTNSIFRSNTISGDRFHGTGMVVSKIVKGNIPVQNGIVHLIDKPLMVVARSLYDYVMEEGKDRNNRLYSFAQLIKDKGGRFGEALLESKDGTLLAPSNEAFRKVDRNKLNYILGHQNLRLGTFPPLH